MTIPGDGSEINNINRLPVPTEGGGGGTMTSFTILKLKKTVFTLDLHLV